MEFKVEFNGLGSLRDMLNNQARQIPFAAKNALNNTAFKLRAKEQEDIRRNLRTTNSYLVNSVRVVKKADKNNLTAIVGLRGSGKGGNAEEILAHHIFGGQRAYTRFEKALHRAGVMPSGWFAVRADGSRFTGAQATQMLSYLSAFGEHGYRANMTATRKSKLAKAGMSKAGYAVINGVAYFVSNGPEHRVGQRSWLHGRGNAQLAKGIWAKTGIHGSSVRPVVLFVSRANYGIRLNWFTIAEELIADTWPSEFSSAMEFARRTAR